MSRVVAVLALCTLASTSHAQTPGASESRSAHEPGEAEEALEHQHAPRHGGLFGDAEDLYHYEVVLESVNRLILYVNDELNQPLDVRTLKGRWTLNPDSQTPTTGPLAASEDGSQFVARLPAESNTTSLHVLVEVLKDGQWVGMEFVLPREAPPQTARPD